MVHTFSCLGQNFLLDVESGTLCRIDANMRKFIDSVNSPSGVIGSGEFSRLRKLYTEDADEVSELVHKGLLFT